MVRCTGFRPAFILLVLLAFLIGAGCASAPSVGVRPEFKQARIGEVAVVPFYASGTFGHAPEEIEALVARYQAEALDVLRAKGFEVLPPEQFRARLEAEGVWQTFADGVELTASLEDYFEPGSTPEITLEVETLRRLVRAKKLPAAVLLFGEVVYESTGICRVDPREHNPHARLVGAGDGKPKAGPCVVSHFQAKLVDARSGQTMWHNRVLIERRATELDDADREANIAAAVAETLGGPHGLDAFQKGRSSKEAVAER